jgi:hypothetical protein
MYFTLRLAETSELSKTNVGKNDKVIKTSLYVLIWLRSVWGLRLFALHGEIVSFTEIFQHATWIILTQTFNSPHVPDKT